MSTEVQLDAFLSHPWAAHAQLFLYNDLLPRQRQWEERFWTERVWEGVKN